LNRALIIPVYLFLTRSYLKQRWKTTSLKQKLKVAVVVYFHFVRKLMNRTGLYLV